MGDRGWLLLGTTSAAVLSYSAVTLSARVLGPADFGLLGALVGTVSLFTVVLSPLASMATHVGALALTHHRTSVAIGLSGPTLATGTVLAILVAAVIALWSDQIGGVFRTTGWWPIALLSPLVAAVAWIQVFKGLLSGLQRFGAFAITTAVEAFVRATLTWPLVTTFAVTGALLAYLAGIVAAAALAILSLGGLGWTLPSRRVMAAPGRTAAASAVLTILLGLLQSADLIAVRWYASPVVSGLYAAAAALGNALFTLVVPLTIPAFSRTLAAMERREPTAPIIAEAVVPVGGIGLVGVVGALWLGGAARVLIFGPDFQGMEAVLVPYAAKTAALLVLAVIGQYSIAVAGPRPLVAATALAGLGPVGVIVLQPEPDRVALIMLLVTLASGGFLSLLLFAGGRIDKPHRDVS